MASEEQLVPDTQRMSLSEAEEVIALHARLSAEKDAEASLPTTKDLSEVLGLSEEKVAALLRDVRRSKSPAPSLDIAQAPALAPSQSANSHGLTAKTRTAAALAAAFILIALMFAMGVIFVEARKASVPPLPVAVSELPPPAEFAPIPADVAFFPLANLIEAKTLGLEAGGKTASLDIPTDLFSAEDLAAEAYRTVKSILPAAKKADAARYTPDEVVRALRMGSSAGMEGIYSFQEVTLTAQSQTVVVKIPIPAQSATGDKTSFDDLIAQEGLTRLSQGLQELSKKLSQ